jgi:hypothetical protein
MSPSGIRTLPSSPAPSTGKGGERDYEAEAKLRVLSLKDAFGFEAFPSTYAEALSYAGDSRCQGMSNNNGVLKIGKFQYKETTVAGVVPDPQKGIVGKRFGIWRILSQKAQQGGISQDTISKTIFPMESWKCAFAIWLLTPESA